MKHKHYECIVAWAEGKDIEWKNDDVWHNLSGLPCWHDFVEYRIKPEIKPDKVRYFSIGRYGAVVIEQWRMVLDKPNVKATFDGETGLLKSVEMV